MLSVCNEQRSLRWHVTDPLGPSSRKCAEVWNEMAVMHEESSRRRRLYYERRGGEKKGHGSHEDYRAAADPSFLWMQNSSSCIHDRERTNVFCVTETLWSQTQKPLCVTWASLYCIPQLSWDFQQQQQEEVVTRREELNWKSLKTLLLTDCKLQHYSWLLLFSIRKDLSAYWENQYSTLGSFELQATTIPHVN